MIRAQALKLPVGDIPDWEVDGNDSEHSDLKSPAESFVILQSLKQSRDKWLRAMFPKFSSRGRGGKQPDVVPPPHTIYNRVFEVHYHPFPVTVSQPTTFVYQSAPGNPSSQAVHQPQAQPSTSSASAGESNALLSPLSSTLPVPPALISQVNTAATSNPNLASLLQLAAAGRATPDQLKALGLLIQSLASSPTTGASATISQQSASRSSPSTPLPTAPAASQQYQYQAAIRDFDIVIEFKEVPSDRWIFPRGPATCESVPAPGDPGVIGDLKISTIIPFPSMTTQSLPGSEASVPAESPPKQVVEFHLKMASSYIRDTFSRWVGSKEKMEENRQVLMEIEPPQQKFLAYRLPEGSQLTQIQNAALLSYAMKAIRPSTESGRPKRRSAPRKFAQDAPGSLTTKRKRQTQAKNQVPGPKIACFACGQANVPLIMGGRYCRPCVESGRIGGASQVSEVTVTNPVSVHDGVQSLPESVKIPPQLLAPQPDKIT